MTETMRFDLALDARCVVGESCVWDAAGAVLLFADIPMGLIHEWRPADGARRHWAFPESVGSFGLCRSGRLVVALRHRVVLLSRDDGRVTEVADLPEPADNRLNDGKVGPDGCFWVGSMDDRPDKEATGSLYRVAPNGIVERKAEGFIVSNGLAWSADGGTLFHSDSRARVIAAHDFDAASGRLSNTRRIATLSDEEGRPDGAACDVDGVYWSAGVSAGCLNGFSATGRLVAKHAFPVPAPTMPCFAGSTLYVTSLREGRSAEALQRFPSLGGVFRTVSRSCGVLVGHFADV